MKPRKRQLHQWKHPFDAYPFEAFLYGSWQPVDLIKIESGRITLHFIDNHHMAMEKSDSEIRIRSRKATLSDCSCFLRPGIDVCVLSASQCSDNSNEFSPDSVWVDAQINSIQRNPHESECSCQYYVNLYVDQGSFGTETRTLSKKIKVVGLDQVSILQRLERNACENQPHRWTSSEECSAVPQAKLLLGKFLSDLSWLAVSSVLKKVSFCVRSVENKIVYQILGSDTTSSSLDTDSHINVVNFKVDNGISVPFVAQVARSDTARIGQHAHDSREDKVSPSYNVEGLRRSKRRTVKPERYFGCGDVPELDVGYVRTRPYKIGTWKDDEEPLPLAIVSSLQENCAEEDVDSSKRVNKVSSCRELIVYQRRKKTREVMLGDTNQNEHQTPLAAIPLPNEGDISSNYSHLTDIPKPMVNNSDLLNFEPQKQPARSCNAKKVDDFFSSCYYSYSTLKPHRKNSFGPDDMDLEPRWEGLNSNKGHREKRYRSTSSRSRNLDEERAHKDRTLNAIAYKEMIDSYLKNRNRIPTKDEPPIMDQWEEISELGQNKETETSQRVEDEEVSEMEMLWREMGEALTSSNLLEETKAGSVQLSNQGSNAAIFTENVKKSSGTCQHDYRLNEEIGICCLICGNVITEIKDITAPFLEVEHSVWRQEKKQYNGEESEPKADEDYGFHLFSTPASHDELISEENENVWKLIPELGKKMHGHQKKAFQFLWKNIAGSMEPALMEAESKRRGGCVISHSPGAGKTFLMIAFLVSYLKLFPGNRPLVLAPKTTLYTWYKEFIKWEIPIPVYLIHARKSQREFKQKSLAIPGVPKPTDDVKHVLDCLEKIQNWHEHPSVLVMGYTSFSSLMREDSKFAHRRYIAKALRESPGILIMDEGHNPRSTKSRLRKALMKVETELRILLSGTLFQNNFCEYFNTLCLARPKFVHEVLKELDPEYKRKRKVAEKARHLLEARARKFFLDNIAKKIDSDNGEERMQGLNVLRNITSGFIDVYDSGNSDTLPGLQIYTLLMNTTDLQHEILKRLHKKMAEYHGYPLEVELLITLGSIHPWLVKTATCAKKFFTLEQLNELEKYKFDMKIGSKVKFVLSLVHRVVKKEKVLIFCHNIAPVKLFVELFEHCFKWQKGREILLLNGELELFERGKVIDKFEEPGGVSKVLLASITACAEGISLTAASRVIMLDSEWNPSKTKQAIARAFRPGQQKMVYVYQLLAAGSLEEDKYRRTTWKEWVSSMIFSEAFVEDPAQWQAEKIEDDILREMVEEDSSKSFHMIMKNEKASTN